VAHGLNPSQHAAVEHDLGPLLVLAGAGSGKTRVVTARIARLLERGVSARSVLAVTFTNKAAGEMHERVAKLVGPKAAKELTVSTFHSFGLGVLRAETKALGFRGDRFAIFDQADQAGVVREVLRTLRADKTYDIGAILGRISAMKNDFVDPATLEAVDVSGVDPKKIGADDYREISELVYPRYVAAMKTFQAFDFDDLICEVANLWRRRPEILEKWQTRFRYLIVDEYQDTNKAQLELVRLLGGGHRNVMVVGDDDQSIYAWRGADVKNILDFEDHFPGARVVKLEENYRSRATVLRVAASILAGGTHKRHQKTIVTTREGGEPVQHVVCVDSDSEAKFVAREIQHLLDEHGARPKDVAILYRSNLQAPEMESALRERQLPYRMIGGTQFYERKEVKDLTAYLKVSLDPGDEIALRRVINYPARGLGDVAVQKLSSFATARDLTLWSAVEKWHAVPDLTPAAREGCRDLVRIVMNVRQRFDRSEPSKQVAAALADDIKLKEDIQAASPSASAAARRWANVDGILGVFGRRDDRGLGGRKDFTEFLRILALREEQDEEQSTDRITLTTMHGAKGLEFPHVFVVGCEEGLLPHARVLTERATDVPMADGAVSLEEERRLFYVAVTRAQDRLWLTRSEKRAFRGKLASRVPSRFLVEIPEDLLVMRQDAPPPSLGMDALAAAADNLLAAVASAGASGDPFANPPPMRRRP
jgi:superfamily I DNA/RNA helicase